MGEGINREESQAQRRPIHICRIQRNNRGDIGEVRIDVMRDVIGENTNTTLPSFPLGGIVRDDWYGNTPNQDPLPAPTGTGSDSTVVHSQRGMTLMQNARTSWSHFTNISELLHTRHPVACLHVEGMETGVQ